MNQILDHSGPKKKQNAPTKNLNDIRKIIKVYAIIILVFGIALIANSAIAISGNKKKPVANTVTKPIITVSSEEDNVIIKVSHDKNIEKIIYQWDDSNAVEKKLEANETEKTLEPVGIPAGEHVLKVTAIDVDNVESYFENTYFSEEGVDMIDPTIEIQSKNPKVTVIARDETALSFITISIDGQDEIRINATEQENKKEIKYTFEVESDETKYKVVAVDTSNNNASKSNVVLKTPKIDFIAEPDYSKIYVSISSELGITRVEYDLNGETTGSDIDNPEDVKECNFEIPTVEGNNDIVVRAYTTNPEVVGKKEGSCTYNP